MATYNERFKEDFGEGRGDWKLLDLGEEKRFFKTAKKDYVLDDFITYNTGIIYPHKDEDEENYVIGLTSLLRNELKVNSYNEYKEYLENVLHNLDLLTDNMELFLKTPRNIVEDTEGRKRFMYLDGNPNYTYIGATVYDHVGLIDNVDLIGYQGDTVALLKITHSNVESKVEFSRKIDTIEDSILVKNYSDGSEVIVKNEKELEEYFDSLNLVKLKTEDSKEIEDEAVKLINKNNLNQNFKDFSEKFYEQLVDKKLIENIG